MKSGLLAGLAVLVLLIAVSVACSAEEEMPFHDPIVITKVGDFTAANGVRGGTGTKDDPFIIEGLRIDASKNGYGIRISQVKSCFVIRGVSVQSASRVGIELVGVSHSAIENCTIDSKHNSLVLKFCYSLLVEGNKFINSELFAIEMQGCRTSKFKCNEFIGKGSGLWAHGDSAHKDSPYKYSSYNTFEGNSFTGMAFVLFSQGSKSNWIYDNDFSEAMVCDTIGRARNCNSWDNGKEGNYWGRNYRGTDSNKDGIGDSKYSVAPVGLDCNYDRYPLMEPWQP